MDIIYENKFNYEGMIDKIPTYTLQEKEVEITENGQLVINPDEGYDCLTSVTANVNVPSSGEGGGGYDIETIINDDGTQEVHIVDAGGAVKMMDFDGTILYSFTREEVMEMTELPDPPDHSDNEVPLTFDGWNWTLESIKEQLDEVGGEVLVGATYHPTDGMTHVIVEIDPLDTVGVQIAFNGTADWGDGTSSTSTGSNRGHSYSEGGRFDIKISGTLQYAGDSSSSTVRYYNKIRKVYLSTDRKEFTNYLFCNCRLLELVTIPSGVTRFGTYTFSYCSSLRTIVFPSSITSISNNAFDHCQSLNSISMSCDMTSIGSNAFSNCYSLKNISIPRGVGEIKSQTFYSCYSLENVKIPDDVITIGNSAFSSCASLKSISIPNSVKNIETSAFFGCSSLEKVTTQNSNLWGGGIFYSCYSLKSMSIPIGVSLIDASLFYQCSSLQSVSIPSSVTEIKDSAFSGCSSLKSVSIPNGVTAIGNNAFNSCISFQTLTIPSSVTSIGSSVFNSCYCTIKMEPTTPPTIQSNTLNSSIPKIIVPKGCLETYQNATNWSSYASKMVEEE